MGKKSTEQNEEEALRETLERLPAKPGVYQMKDAEGRILYIGKAKSLRNRVRSYFQPSAAHSPRIGLMMSKARSVDVVVTGSELEALILEDNLVKKEQPPYNVMLRDDKNYPYLKLTTNEKFPRLVMVRKAAKDGATYFGPYVSGKSVKHTMRLIQRIFPLRQSKDDLAGKPPRRPCLNYQMGRCLAPCAGKVGEEEYAAVVNDVALFLRGRNEELIAALESKMAEASENQWYEAAARYRDQIAAIRDISEKQTITDTGLADEDVVAAYEEGGRMVIKLLRIRGGKMNSERGFTFERLDRLDRAEALAAFLRQFYGGGMDVPPVIIVNAMPEGAEALMELLSTRRGAKVNIIQPVRGRKRKLAGMAENNARLQLETELAGAKARAAAATEVMERLGLAAPPKVIEGYDISNTGGVSSVGAVVVFRDGDPAKGAYRKYKIAVVEGPDDYSSLAEVIERRFRRMAAEEDAGADLLVIDGGKGQVAGVMKKFAEMGVNAPPVVGVAKGEDRENVNTDRFFVPVGAGKAQEARFPPSSPGRFLLQRVRDEAHRFAISYHKKLRDGALTRSVLDAAPGVGPKRKKALLRKFGSVKRIKEATVEEIAGALGVSERVARKIHEAL